MVLADGTAVTATKDNQHSELFWGLQGGGSNLGIVSSLTMRAHPIKYAYSGLVMNLAPSSGSAHSTIRNWAEWIGRSARSVSGACVLACGQPVVSTAIVEADTQAVDQGELASQTIRDFPSLAPLRGCGFSGAFGACASIKSLQRTDYHSGTQRMLEGFQKPGHYHSATLVVPELGGKLLDTLVDFTRNRHPNSTSGAHHDRPHSANTHPLACSLLTLRCPARDVAAVITFPLGGAVAEMKEGCTACNLGRGMPGAFWVLIQGQFQPGGGDRKQVRAHQPPVPPYLPSRNDHRDLQMLTAPSPDLQVVAWVRDLRASLIEGGAMETMDTLDGNFVVGNNQAPSSALGTSEARLQRTKARYDPNNLFQCNRNIRPTTASQPKPQQPVIPSLKMPPYAKEKEVDGAVPVDGVVISPRHRPPPTPPPRMSPKAVYRL